MKFYEHHTEEPISHMAFRNRVFRHAVLVALMLSGALLLGVVGFWVTSRFAREPMSMMDSFVDSSMLLGGMGPVKCGGIDSDLCRLFASLYALFCGLLFVTIMGILAAPLAHRLLHMTFHAPKPSNAPPATGPTIHQPENPNKPT